VTISHKTLVWLRHAAAGGRSEPQALLDLLERVEALEQRPTCKQSLQVPPTPEAAPVATNKELRQIWEGAGYVEDALRTVYNLGRQHGAAQPAPPAAPAGGLVERVVEVIADSDGPAELWHDDARAAIREVAAWLDQQGQHGCSLLLREEANRG
jgi:hypothetical protein